MYTFDEKMKAIALYEKFNHRAASVIRELGYPEHCSLTKWLIWMALKNC